MTRKRILLYLDRSFQELKSAIFNYAEQTDWQLEVATIHFPSRWHGDGILTDYLEPEQFESLSKDIPIVARSAFFAPLYPSPILSCAFFKAFSSSDGTLCRAVPP